MNRTALLRVLAAATVVTIGLGAFVGGQDADLAREAFQKSPTLPKRAAHAPLYHEALALHGPVLLTGERSWLAGIAHEPLTGDRVVVTGWPVSETAELRSVTATPGQVLHLTGELDGAGRPHLVWADVTADGGRLLTSWLEEDRWTEPAALTRTPDRASHVQAVRRGDGSVWLAWQRDRQAEDAVRSQVDVAVGRLDGGALTDVHAITDRSWSDRHPALCETRDGALWVAWTACTGRDYEIQARRLAPDDSEFGAALNVSQHTIADDFHPSLAAAADGGLWVAWDRLLDPLRGESRKDSSQIEVSLRLAHIGAHGVQVPDVEGVPPGEIPGPGSYTRSGGRPNLAVDAQGRIHVVYRFLDNHDAPTFPVCWQVFDGASYSEPVEFERSGGDFENVSVQYGNGQLHLVYQQHVHDGGRLAALDFDVTARSQADLDEGRHPARHGPDR